MSIFTKKYICIFERMFRNSMGPLDMFFQPFATQQKNWCECLSLKIILIHFSTIIYDFKNKLSGFLLSLCASPINLRKSTKFNFANTKFRRGFECYNLNEFKDQIGITYKKMYILMKDKILIFRYLFLENFKISLDVLEFIILKNVNW